MLVPASRKMECPVVGVYMVKSLFLTWFPVALFTNVGASLNATPHPAVPTNLLPVMTAFESDDPRKNGGTPALPPTNAASWPCVDNWLFWKIHFASGLVVPAVTAVAVS